MSQAQTIAARAAAEDYMLLLGEKNHKSQFAQVKLVNKLNRVCPWKILPQATDPLRRKCGMSLVCEVNFNANIFSCENIQRNVEAVRQVDNLSGERKGRESTCSSDTLLHTLD